jgi:hypothetical protein
LIAHSATSSRDAMERAQSGKVCCAVHIPRGLPEFKTDPAKVGVRVWGDD